MKVWLRAAGWGFLGLLMAAFAVFCWFGVSSLQPDSRKAAAGGLKFRTVVIDAGHGGIDTGAQSKGLNEKTLTLDVARKLAAILRKEGLRVVLTRDEDAFVSLPNRVQIANAENDSIFVSIHFNQTENAAADGIETFLASQKSVGREAPWNWLRANLDLPSSSGDEELARAIQEELVETSRGKNRGVKERNFFVIRRVVAPAVLVEGGFVSNSRAASRLRSPAYRTELAEAMARGIFRYREGKSGGQTLLAKRTE